MNPNGKSSRPGLVLDGLNCPPFFWKCDDLFFLSWLLEKMVLRGRMKIVPKTMLFNTLFLTKVPIFLVLACLCFPPLIGLFYWISVHKDQFFMQRLVLILPSFWKVPLRRCLWSYFSSRFIANAMNKKSHGKKKGRLDYLHYSMACFRAAKKYKISFIGDARK